MTNETTNETQNAGLIASGGEGDTDFITELRQIINKHSMENGSNTPDFILAQYLSNCLRAWNAAAKACESWYECSPKLINHPV